MTEDNGVKQWLQAIRENPTSSVGVGLGVGSAEVSVQPVQGAAAPTDLLEGLEDVRRLTVRPSDILVFRFKHALRPEYAVELRRRIRDQLGLSDDIKVLVLDQGTALDVLEKATDAEAP